LITLSAADATSDERSGEIVSMFSITATYNPNHTRYSEVLHQGRKYSNAHLPLDGQAFCNPRRSFVHVSSMFQTILNFQ